MHKAETKTFHNPFVPNRAEQMGDEVIYEYFVSDGLEDLLTTKPLVLEGGRGCGKTMFFLYHSYWAKKYEYLGRGLNLTDLLSKEPIIGIYYRADSSFVTAFQHKNLDETEWRDIYAHYLNLQLSIQVLDVVVDMKKADGIALTNEESTCERVCPYLINVADEPTTFEDLLGILNKQRATVVMYINNVGRIERPILIPPGVLVSELIAGLSKESIFKNKVFQFFIDEFENLLDHQQVLINSFIKGSKPPIIYNISVRKKGRRKRETLAPNEIIGEPHDYKRFDLETAIEKNYETLLQKVCFKRLKQHPELQNRDEDDKWLYIDTYLGKYNIDDELSSLLEHHPQPAFMQELRERITENIVNKSELEVALNHLANPEKYLISRLNLVLLERSNPPTIDELLSELGKYETGKSSKYKEWLHNNKVGMLFLLCHELGERKKYYGFDVFSALSSGIIRYFLELCEHAFRNASMNDFTFLQPRPLTQREMDTAAHHVSRYKFNDIETYPPYGPQMKRFILLLGGIFSALHKDNKLSEPERNHFYTRMDEVSINGKQILDSAVMWTVLQEKSPTKLKEPTVPYEEIDYHLNRIYAPLFQISYRQMRKLFIVPKYLNNMLEKQMRIGRESAINVLKRHKIEDVELGPSQLEMWGIIEERI